MLCCDVLRCNLWYGAVMYCTVLCCMVLYGIVLHCAVLEFCDTAPQIKADGAVLAPYAAAAQMRRCLHNPSNYRIFCCMEAMLRGQRVE